MKLKYDFNCETCIHKKLCKYYKDTNKYCEKELEVRLKPKEETSSENLIIKINCRYYDDGKNILNYPNGAKDISYPGLGRTGDVIPYGGITNITDTIRYDTDGSKNLNNVVTTKKHI